MIVTIMSIIIIGGVVVAAAVVTATIIAFVSVLTTSQKYKRNMLCRRDCENSKDEGLACLVRLFSPPKCVGSVGRLEGKGREDGREGRSGLLMDGRGVGKQHTNNKRTDKYKVISKHK